MTIPQLERERENLRLALGWCAERRDAERGLRLAVSSTDLWWQAGPRAEGLAWLRRFLAQAPPDLPAWLRLRVLVSVALLAWWLDEMAAVRANVTEGLALAESWHDEQALAAFLYLSVGPALQDGDLTAAQAFAEQGLALTRRARLGNRQGAFLMALGTAAQFRGDVAGAAARYGEALPLGTNRQYAMRNLGYLALEAGRIEEAAARFRAALEDTWRRRADSAVLEHLRAFAALARTRGQWVQAARLVGAADAGLERLGGVLIEPIGRRERERTLAAGREHMDASAFLAAYAAGRALTLVQAVAEALAE